LSKIKLSTSPPPHNSFARINKLARERVGQIHFLATVNSSNTKLDIFTI
jgi:hypothetical protein